MLRRSRHPGSATARLAAEPTPPFRTDGFAAEETWKSHFFSQVDLTVARQPMPGFRIRVRHVDYFRHVRNGRVQLLAHFPLVWHCRISRRSEKGPGGIHALKVLIVQGAHSVISDPSWNCPPVSGEGRCGDG